MPSQPARLYQGDTCTGLQIQLQAVTFSSTTCNLQFNFVCLFAIIFSLSEFYHKKKSNDPLLYMATSQTNTDHDTNTVIASFLISEYRAGGGNWYELCACQCLCTCMCVCACLCVRINAVYVYWFVLYYTNSVCCLFLCFSCSYTDDIACKSS